MKINLIKKAAATLACIATTTLAALAAPYQTGEAVAAFDAKDQHDKAWTFNAAETRFLLVTHDMDTGKKANAVLTTVGPANLEQKKVVYLANIFGMPAVGRMFALPKMRKYSHRIILADNADLIARFPTEAGKVTVLTLKNSKVETIKYWNPETEKIDDFLK